LPHGHRRDVSGSDIRWPFRRPRYDRSATAPVRPLARPSPPGRPPGASRRRHPRSSTRASAPPR